MLGRKKIRWIRALLILLVTTTWLNNTTYRDFVFAENVTENPDIIAGKVLVKYKNGKSLLSKKSFISMEQGNSNGGEFLYGEITVPAGESTHRTIQALTSDPEIEYAEPLYIRRALFNYNPDISENSTVAQSIYNPNDYKPDFQWGLDKINIMMAWEKSSLDERKQITVAVVDTGVDLDHPDLQDSIVPGYNFIKDNNMPDDDNGHGTHVAGIIGAIADNNQGIAGVAAGVKIMPVKVLDDRGYGSNTTVTNGIIYAVDRGADIINLSLGSANISQVENAAIQYALGKGVLVIAASGNESNHWISGETGNLDPNSNDQSFYMPVLYPAACEGVIAVGAVDNYSDTGMIIADFSNAGPEIDVSAPGVRILSTFKNNSYALMRGTSMATPFVAGLAALVKASAPSLNPEDITRIINSTANDKGTEGHDIFFGNGVIDAGNAFGFPRLNIVGSSSQMPGQYTVELMAADYKNTVNAEVYGDIQLVVQRYNTQQTQWVDTETHPVRITDGLGTVQLNLADIARYRVLANPGNEKFVPSPYYLIERGPEPPTANLASGTYSSSKSVTLTTGTQGADIYYTLNGSEPGINTTKYTGAISINSTKELKAVSVKDGLVSSVSSYQYTIDIPQIKKSGGGGGGGGGSSVPVILPVDSGIDKTTMTKDAEGKVVLSIEVSDNRIKSEIQKPGNTSVEVLAVSTEKTDKFEMLLSGSALNELTTANKALRAKIDAINIEVLPGAIPVENSEKVKMSVSLEDKQIFNKDNPNILEYRNQRSQVHHVDILKNGNMITDFKKPITVSLAYDISELKDKDFLGAYCFNSEKSDWEYIGGKVNNEGRLSFSADKSGQYIIAEYYKSFDDIKEHWAKEYIEVLTSKYIVKGLNETHFEPESQITRAEFAALLVRVLGIDVAEDENPFSDIKPDSWYKEVVAKAYKAGIINGLSEQLFGPDRVITREEMAVMIMRAYQYKTGEKLDEMITTTEVRFGDEDNAGSWARRSIILSDAVGLMQGNPDGRFVPKGNTTRAEASVVIQRLLQK